MKKYLFYRTKIEGLQAVEEMIQIIEKSASSYIHSLKKRVLSMQIYKAQIQMILKRLSLFYWNDNHPLLQKRSGFSKALLVISGTKGIAGGLYHNLVNEAVAKRNLYQYIWVIGNKAREYLEEEGILARELFYTSSYGQEPSLREIKMINYDILNKFKVMRLQRIDILYPRFLSLVNQKPATVQFLPLDFSSDDSSDAVGFPIFEPSDKLIFDMLLKKYIEIFFAEIALEAKLSEFAARTVTAENAIKETEDLLSSLRCIFLKEKHRAITQKQIESFSVHQIT